MKKLYFNLSGGHVTLWSVQYGHSVQYGLGLLHAPLGNGPPIALALIDRIHHEIKFNVSVYIQILKRSVN